MRKSLALVTVLAAFVLAGCSHTVALTPADNAIDSGCAEVVAHAPEVVADLERRDTDAQGTLAYGDPASVIVRCGVEEPGPTAALKCVETDGVHWLRDESDAPIYIFTTYGRSPATEVIVDRDAVAPGLALLDLVPAVSGTTEVGQCTDIEDSL